MDKYLEEKSIAEKYWIKQLKDININFIDPLNITTYNFIDNNGSYHLYPDNDCSLCIELKNMINDYFSSDYEQRSQILKPLQIYSIDNKEINENLLFNLQKINVAIENLNNNKMECKTCEVINELCNQYYNSNDDNEKEKIIDRLKKYEMNGYQLLHFREHNGYPLNELEIINHYLFENKDIDHFNIIQNIDPLINKDISLDRSRWCKACGARKPDEIIIRK